MILRLLSLLALLAISVAAAASPSSITVYAWPLSASSPKPFAEISLPSTPNNAPTLKSKKPVSVKDGELVRIGLLDSNKAWSGVATSAESFKAGIVQKISLHTDSEGAVAHVSFSSFKRAPGSATSGKDKDLLVEIVPVQDGSEPVLNKPVVLNAEGKLDKPDEDNRTFLQKYDLISPPWTYSTALKHG